MDRYVQMNEDVKGKSASGLRTMIEVLSLLKADVPGKILLDRNPLTAPAETSVQAAILAMERAKADCIFAIAPLASGGSRFLGTFSGRELVRVIALGRDLTKLTLAEGMVADDADALQESDLQSLDTLLRQCHRDGRSSVPVVGEGGEFVGALVLPRLLKLLSALNFDDLERQTAEKLLEQRLQTSESRLRVLIESVRDIVLVVEAEGTGLEIVPTYPALAYDPDIDLIGQTIELFTREPTAAAFVRPVRDALAQQKTVSFEYSLPVSQTDIWYDARISPLSERSALWVARDITQRKRAEVEVLKVLEQERELNELKSRFIAIASHEFRTPLSIIHSSAQLLQRYDWERDEQLRHLQQIQSSVQQMTALMEDVLFLGKTEAGQLRCQPERFDLLDFCDNLVARMQLTAGAHSLAFEPALPAGREQVFLDKKLLQQILNNLLANAIAYSPGGSRVELSVKLEGGNNLAFAVRDSGYGIPSEDRSHLFESFYRARNVSHLPGTGLGLTIVKQCVELQGGAIACESQLGVGTTFRVTLPDGLSP